MRRTFAIACILAASCTLNLTRDLAPGELRGSFVLQQGADALPVKGAIVSLAGGLASRTDDRGRFVFRRLEPGTYRLQVRWDRDGDGTIDAGLTLSRVEVSSGGRGRDLGSVAIGAPGRIKGTVDDAGRPLSGLGVAVSGVGDFACAGDGTFDSGPLYPGLYDVAVHYIDEAGRAVLLRPKPVSIGDAQVVVLDTTLALGSGDVVTESGSVSGVVIAPGAPSQAGTSVALVVSNAPPATTDEAGLFSFASVSPGVYALQATREGFRAAVYDHLVVAGDVDVPTLALSPVDDPPVEEGVGCGESPVVEDSDGDGILNVFELDGCLCDAADGDEDGFCDSIDRDRDGDGFDNALDRCPDDSDPAQEDFDADGAGDACDADLDGDGAPNTTDSCPARFELDPSPSNCPNAFALLEPSTTTVPSPTSVVTITGTCPASPATASVLVTAPDSVVSQGCRPDGTFVATVALDLDARSHPVRVLSDGTPPTDTTLTFLLPPGIATVGPGADFENIDAALSATTPPTLIVLSEGSHTMTGGRAVTGSLAIEAAPGTTPTLTLAGDMPDDASASSAWFHVRSGGSLVLRGLDIDGRGRLLRAGIVRVDAGGVAVVRESSLRGAVANTVGTAVWSEGTARLVDVAISDVGRIGVLASGERALVSLWRVSFAGSGAASQRLNYFIVAEAGATAYAREVAAVDLLGVEPGGLPSQAIVAFDANLDVSLSVFTPTPADSAVVVVEEGAAASRSLRLRSNAFVAASWPDDVLAVFNRSVTTPVVDATRSWWNHRTGPGSVSTPAGRGAQVVGPIDVSGFSAGFVDREPAVPGWQR